MENKSARAKVQGFLGGFLTAMVIPQYWCFYCTGVLLLRYLFPPVGCLTNISPKLSAR